MNTQVIQSLNGSVRPAFAMQWLMLGALMLLFTGCQQADNGPLSMGNNGPMPVPQPAVPKEAPYFLATEIVDSGNNPFLSKLKNDQPPEPGSALGAGGALLPPQITLADTLGSVRLVGIVFKKNNPFALLDGVGPMAMMVQAGQTIDINAQRIRVKSIGRDSIKLSSVDKPSDVQTLNLSDIIGSSEPRPAPALTAPPSLGPPGSVQSPSGLIQLPGTNQTIGVDFNNPPGTSNNAPKTGN